MKVKELKVLKRDGITIVDFNKDKIAKAIEKAMISCNQYEAGVPEDIADSVAEIIYERYNDSNDTIINIEDIQDIVEDQLINLGYVSNDVIKEYITYRYRRNIERISESKLADEAEKIIHISDPNINHENANLNGSSHSGKLSKLMSSYSKWYTNISLLSDEVKNAYESNRIHIHDLDWYINGAHNCTFIDIGRLLKKGFNTGNGSIRRANSLRTAFNLTPIIFQSQQNSQYGGVATNKIDYDLEPFVNVSFTKIVKELVNSINILMDKNDPDWEKYNILKQDIDSKPEMQFSISNETFKKLYPKLYDIAYDKLEREAKDSAQAFIHNLNTMCSRVGSQVPFTSINYGTCTSKEGRLVIKAILEATLDGLGNHETPIFPIQIFKVKKGVTRYPGDPNYDLYQLAIKCFSKRMYPNFVNCDASYVKDMYIEGNPDTEACTMGKLIIVNCSFKTL